ncbi:MAG: dTDP-4-dehydrorhamnose reductase [Legionellales bacterium]|jgi:dTDP-4-dehydrorhamnose reductase
MKILLFGAQGQVGFELQRSLAGLGQVIVCNRSMIDLNDLNKLETFIRNTQPNIIINAAAYTQVDKAEQDEAQAEKINAQAPFVMAKIAQELNSWMIHYSTDYIFNGLQTKPYIETDLIDPLNVYGKTKAQGEELIRSSGARHLILRTSWVYAAHGHNFARTILNLAQQRGSLNIVGDQIGVPTSAELIADITALIIYRLQWDNAFKDFKGDTFNLTAQGSTSWYGFASYLIMHAQQLGMPLKVTPDKITAIATAQYPTPAKRPANSLLNTEKISKCFNLQLPPWQWHADRFLSQYYLQRGISA